MKTFAPTLRNACLLTVSLVSLVVSGCQPCDLTNMSVSARVVITTISAPPGGPARRFLEVRASGFHPNVPVRLSIPSYPTNNGTESLVEMVVTDAQGAITWTKEPVTFVGLGADPNVDISITVAEVNSGCFAIINIKQREFMKLQ